jgi:hypothetical protein
MEYVGQLFLRKTLRQNDITLCRRSQPGNQSQQCAFSAARRPYDRDKFAFAQQQIHGFKRTSAIGIGFACAANVDCDRRKIREAHNAILAARLAEPLQSGRQLAAHKLLSPLHRSKCLGDRLHLTRPWRAITWQASNQLEKRRPAQ